MSEVTQNDVVPDERGEKDLEVGRAPSQTTSVSKEVAEAANVQIDWTPEEEKRLVRRLDFLVLPPLVLAFFALQLDRGNIGSALTDGFTFDIGITQNQYNTGNTLMSVGIVILEIPSNLILYKLGPTIWIGGQVFAWGLVATFQAFQKGLGPYYATRLLLGLCESGFIPAGLYTLSRWYKRDEISKRFAVYFFGNNLATALSGLLAFGILRLEGRNGLQGWQWLFIIEGIYTIAAATYFLVTFPKSPSRPVSFFRLRFFTERESHILEQRVLIDDPAKALAPKAVTWTEFKRTIMNWKLFSHIVIPLCALAPSWTFAAYAPYLVMAMGYGKLEANALCSIGGFLLLPMNLLCGFLADKFHRRGPIVAFVLLIFFSLAVANRMNIYVNDKTMRLPLLIVMVAFSSCWYPINASWVSLNAKTPEERTISMAIVVMCANLAGIIGSQLFQSQDAPYYPHGWNSIAGCVAVAMFFSWVANAQYFFLNQRLRRKGATGDELYRP